MEQEIKCNHVGMLSGDKWDKLHDQSRRVYGIDGVAPTIHTCGGGNSGPKILEPKVKVVGNYSPSGHNASSIVDVGGIAPTVMENHGTVTAIREPRIATMRGRNPDNPSDRKIGSPIEQRLEIGNEETSNTLTKVQKDYLVVEPTFIERAIRESGGETMSFDPSQSKKFGYRKPLSVARDNSASCVIENYQIRKLTEQECFRLMGVKEEDFERVRYGKSLPNGAHQRIVNRTMNKVEWKECWRIIRHDRQSVSSCYHLAGDSIVTTCLMAIFGELFSVDYQDKINSLTEELRK